MTKLYRIQGSHDELLRRARFVLENSDDGGLPVTIQVYYANLIREIIGAKAANAAGPVPTFSEAFSTDELLWMVRFVLKNSDGGGLPGTIEAHYLNLMRDLNAKSAPLGGKAAGKVYQLQDFRG